MKTRSFVWATAVILIIAIFIAVPFGVIWLGINAFHLNITYSFWYWCLSLFATSTVVALVRGKSR